MSHIKKVHQENKVKKKKNIIPNPGYACGEVHFYNDCSYKNKECFRCKKKGYKKTYFMTKVKRRVNNYVKVTNVDKSPGRNIRVLYGWV